jgi:hypothetical protein
MDIAPLFPSAKEERQQTRARERGGEGEREEAKVGRGKGAGHQTPTGGRYSPAPHI